MADGAKVFPVRTGSAALALSIFAPRNASEFHRLLGPCGMLLVATPTSRHLRELIEQRRVARLDEWTDVTASFTVSLYRKKKPGS